MVPSEITTIEDAREYIAPIVTLLDEDRPGWSNLVNVETLQLMDPWNCVLGQVYESWLDGVNALETLVKTRGIDDVNVDVSYATAVTNSEPIGLAWFELIRERQAS